MLSIITSDGDKRYTYSAPAIASYTEEELMQSIEAFGVKS